MSGAFRRIESGVNTLCGIWANRKSFLLTPRRRASPCGKYSVRIQAVFTWEVTELNK